jgi:hypothetical protein
VPHDALEYVADAEPGLLQHARLSDQDPGEVRPDHHRGDLEDQLVDVGVARQLSPGDGLPGYCRVVAFSGPKGGSGSACSRSA